MSKTLTHFNANGEAYMVDVSNKAPTVRTAIARSEIHCGKAAYSALKSGTAKKGDVLSVARIAAIQAVKHTSLLIPLCHPLPVVNIDIDFKLDDENQSVTSEVFVKTEGKTGVEMEALTGASVASLTIYDMLKAVDKSMVIGPTALHQKTGGKSGDYTREEHTGE